MLSSGDFVTELYHSVLHRAPDAEGMKVHVDLLEASGNPLGTAAQFLADFRNSDEGRRWHTPVEVRPVPAYDRVLAMGTHCVTAWAAQACRRRHASYPFDWLFSSSRMILHCLDTDFADFLAPHFHATAPNGSAVDHLLYRDRFDVGDVFAHRDPRDPTHAAYYLRCVERFRKATKSNSRYLAVMIASRPAEDAMAFPGLAVWFNRAFPAATLKLVTVLPPTGQGVSSIGFTPGERLGEHQHLHYQASSALGGLNFDNPIDDMMIRALLMEQPIVG